jgi:hypothetical protein
VNLVKIILSAPVQFPAFFKELKPPSAFRILDKVGLSKVYKRLLYKVKPLNGSKDPSAPY